MHNARILSFADDTSLVNSDANVATLYQRANVEINNLFESFCLNGLPVNYRNTKFIVFNGCSKNVDFNNLNVSVDGTHLEQIGSHLQMKTTRSHGMFVDKSLSWKYHLTQVKN